MENVSKKNISKKALSIGILANLRPLFNSNMAQVPIVKWSEKCIFVVQATATALGGGRLLEELMVLAGQALGLLVGHGPVLAGGPAGDGL